jgi:hypothetical protein
VHVLFLVAASAGAIRLQVDTLMAR